MCVIDSCWILYIENPDQGATNTHAIEPVIKSNNLRKNSEKSSQQSAAKTQTQSQTKTNSRQLAKPVHTSTQVPLNDPPEVSVTVSRSLKNLQNNFKEMRDNQQGLNENLKYVGEQAECNYDDISTLKTENINLRRELELLRSVVIRMDRRISIMDNEITDLRSRSMRDNILIHNFKYTPNEDLAASMPALIKQTLGVDVSFVRIHRNGVLHKKSDRPVTITAKLTDRNKKDEILNAQKSKKIARVSLPFYITPQQPPALVSARNKLFDKSDSLKKQNISVKISRNSIVLPNGSKYSEEVPLLSNAAVLKIDQTESEQLDDIVTMNTEPIQKNGSEFYATGTKVGSVNQAQNFYKKVCIDPYVASVDSRILIYRFMEQGKLIENYHDDGEHGAGRRLLKYMRENQIMDVAIVVTRWMGEHIGPQRFTIMEGLVNEVANLILE